VSYDIDIYFSQPTPPVASMESVLSLLDMPVTAQPGLEWSIWTGTGTVWIEILEISFRPCAPADAKWRACVSSAMMRGRAAHIALFAIPYAALLLIEGTSVHDCQAHNLGIFTTPDAWLEFARTQCRDVDLPFSADRKPWLHKVALDRRSDTEPEAVERCD
jgi:hypothetical protein